MAVVMVFQAEVTTSTGSSRAGRNKQYAIIATSVATSFLIFIHFSWEFVEGRESARGGRLELMRTCCCRPRN